MINLATLGTEVDFTQYNKSGGKYTIQFPPTDYIIVHAAAKFGTPAMTFNHPNVAARTPRVYESKHYMKHGGKFWKSHAVVEYSFIIPKKNIELHEECGYSYVKVNIGTQKYHFNVSGGGGSNGWTDFVHEVVSIGFGHTLKSLKNLAANSIHPEHAEAKGIQCDIRGLSEGELETFANLTYAHATRKTLAFGDRIFLRKGLSVGSDKDPMLIIKPREGVDRYIHKRSIICAYTMYQNIRVTDKQVDWTRTGEAKGIPPADLSAFNRIGKLTGLEKETVQ
jgi:hypothetical protein